MSNHYHLAVSTPKANLGQTNGVRLCSL
jgi:hypothetical protein